MDSKQGRPVGYSYPAPPFFLNSQPLNYPVPHSIPINAPLTYVTESMPSVTAMDNLPTPSDSSNSTSSPSGSGDEQTQFRNIFRPVDFERYSADAMPQLTPGSTYYPLTPTSSEGSGDGSPVHTGGITAQLVDKELWESFGEVGNEMIVTKPGR